MLEKIFKKISRLKETPSKIKEVPLKKMPSNKAFSKKQSVKILSEKNSPKVCVNSRNKLIKAAVKLFGQKSFTGTSTREIAKLAGVNISMIKYYFGSKEGLYRAILDDLLEKQHNILNKLADEKKIENNTKEENARLLLSIFNEAINFLYDKISNDLMIFLVKEQQNQRTAFIPPIVKTCRKIFASIMEQSEDSREVVFKTQFLVAQINSPRLTPSFLYPYGKGGKYTKEDIGYIKANAKDYVEKIIREAKVKI